jgi:glucose/arabinose dehydrogenase/mono/diheme cytochrome c family protein
MDKKPVFSLTAFIMLLYMYSCDTKRENTDGAAGSWEVPAEMKNISSPDIGDQDLVEGRSLYQVYCWACHGEAGAGDGAAGGAMGSQPANLVSEAVQAQSDGSLFWKISEGRNVMPGFREVLSEKERWQLVGFIRQLATAETTENPSVAPVPLVNDLEVTHWAKTVARVVRIWFEPEDQKIWYATLNGEVFRFPIDEPHELEKVLTAEDHGITRMQGAVMHGQTLYLTGNIRVNEDKGTTGWMMRIRWDEQGRKIINKVFSTAEYGTTSTPFDHGWSATAISPDEKYIFVASGSRTDHGEVSDNLGAYPNARDEALTAKIFRIPIDAENLLLLNDIDWLKEKGYLYAEGVRNAFDFGFNEEERLFAVVNSGDYDQNEDMFWIREGHHYGYPWVMGGMDNPQQFPDWFPDPEQDPFLNPSAAARPDDFHNDPDFPKRPEGVVFTKGFENYGPDADKFRDTLTGKVLDASELNLAITTFTPHSSPLGLVFDIEHNLPGRFKGSAFTIRYTNGKKSNLMAPFTENGEDLLHLIINFDPEKDNYNLHTYRIAAGFNQPVDAVLVDNAIFVAEFGGRERGGNIWKVSFNKP